MLLAAVGVALYALWVVRPLTDRGAGVIPPGLVPSLPETPKGGGGQAPAKLPAFGAGAASTRPIPGVGAAAGLVVEAESGHVLWMASPHKQRAIASLTKMMTALVAVRAHRTTGTFVITPAMTDVPGETMGLSAGERVSRPRHAGGHPAALGQRRRERPGRPHRRAASPRSSSG